MNNTLVVIVYGKRAKEQSFYLASILDGTTKLLKTKWWQRNNTYEVRAQNVPYYRLEAGNRYIEYANLSVNIQLF